MKLVVVLALVVLQGVLVSSLDAFRDCPNHCTSRFPSTYDTDIGRCCISEEVPNGCECFDISSKSDFYSKLRIKPECPPQMGVEFHLFTRSNRNESVVVKAHDDSLGTSPFNPSLPTKFITHGFTDHGPAPWSLSMMNTLLDEGDMNVIIVNWKKGAEGPIQNYYQAAANVRSTGAMVAQLIRVMKNKHGAKLSDIHLIGHSLGAHVSGIAGKELQRLESESIGRISGLDPAGLGFEKYTPNVRVDASDADFVDIIHTDAESVFSSGFGTRYSIGHVDFYPNGGQHQPGCPTDNFLSMFSGGALHLHEDGSVPSSGVCSHIIVLDYFTSSIKQCQYLPPDGDATCRMGYHTSPSCRGDYYPTTSDAAPYC